MDLNYLLHRHQVARMHAQHATSLEAAHAHRGLARCYEQRIAETRALLGASGTMVLA